MNIRTALSYFYKSYNRVPNKQGPPNWIHCTFEDNTSVHYAVYDFKNGEARRAFGALCHQIYTSVEVWSIKTVRQTKP